MQGRDLLGVSERALGWLSRQHTSLYAAISRNDEQSDPILNARLKQVAWLSRYRRSMKGLPNS